MLARQLEQDQAALKGNKACLSCGSKARGGAGGEQHAGHGFTLSLPPASAAVTPG